MTKEAKRALILSTLVCLIPLIAGLVLYSRLPEQVVTHWDAQGNPNGWSSRFTGVFVLPGLLLVLNLLCPVILKMDPKYSSMSDKMKCLVQWIFPLVELFAAGSTLAYALGAEVKMQLIVPMFLGVLFVIIGNFLPKMSQSYTVGIKLPWTLDDPENWERTHRFAGFLWVICGLLTIICSFLPGRMTVCLVLVFVMAFVPMLYSFTFYLRKKKNSREDKV